MTNLYGRGAARLPLHSGKAGLRLPPHAACRSLQVPGATVPRGVCIGDGLDGAIEGCRYPDAPLSGVRP